MKTIKTRIKKNKRASSYSSYGILESHSFSSQVSKPKSLSFQNEEQDGRPVSCQSCYCRFWCMSWSSLEEWSSNTRWTCKSKKSLAFCFKLFKFSLFFKKRWSPSAFECLLILRSNLCKKHIFCPVWRIELDDQSCRILTFSQMASVIHSCLCRSKSKSSARVVKKRKMKMTEL